MLSARVMQVLAAQDWADVTSCVSAQPSCAQKTFQRHSSALNIGGCRTGCCHFRCCRVLSGWPAD